MATQSVARRYHSVALLMPDGRVLTAGSTGSFPHGWAGDAASPSKTLVLEFRLEIFQPPYLFRGPRPRIVAAPSEIRYGATMDIEYQGADAINSIVLIRPGAVTHTNDMDQRCLRLSLEAATTGQVTVRTPIDGTWAPPGWYMLFVLNPDQVPSVGHFVHLT
jgi:hypothetical protein